MDGKEAQKNMLDIIIREMHIKTTIRYYFIHTRMVVIKKPDNYKCWRKHGEIGTLLVGM